MVFCKSGSFPALQAGSRPDGACLPIGVQMIGAYGADDMLLELGAAYEAAAPRADRWPPL